MILRRLLIVGVALLVGLALLWLSSRRAPSRVDKPTESELREIESLMRVQFPKSARPTAWVRGSAVGDWHVLLKLDMPASELERFLQNSPFADVDLDSEVGAFYVTGDLPWWDQSQAVLSCLRGGVNITKDRRLIILVDTQNDQLYCLYLALFGT